jgi:hypothetical protein
MWLKAATCRQLTTVLADLIEGSEYKFRIKAENPYGVSDPSPESDVVFIPDIKRGLLEPPPRTEENLSDPWLDEMKKRQLEEDQPEEQQEVKRRRGLEERMDKLLGQFVPDMNKKTQLSLTPDKSPTLSNRSKSGDEMDVENIPPVVPRRRGKKTSDLMEEILIKDIKVDKVDAQPKVPDDSSKVDGTEVIPKSKETEGEKWRLAPRDNDDSVMHGSSELMLVLLPHGQASKSTELSKSSW